MAVAHQASEPAAVTSVLAAGTDIASLAPLSSSPQVAAPAGTPFAAANGATMPRAKAPPAALRGRQVGRLLKALPWRDLLAHLVFVTCAAALLSPALRGTAIHWQDDTKYFYFPLLANLAAALKEGRLPLWEPGIFGGFPLFSDGESGMLYPLHLVTLRVLDPVAALIVMRALRFYLAGAFTYAFLRVIGVSRTGATAGGIVFMLSGFMVGQIVHENLDNGMIWLPLVLYFVERAFRTAGPRRFLLAAYGGVAVAMQAMAVHVQVCVFTALLVGPYIGWRLLFRDTINARIPLRLLLGGVVGAVLGLVAFGMSAVQMLSLLDLADRSARGHGISLSASTINSVTPFRLLTVFFPHLLKGPDGSGFGYWVEWEVTLYVGVPALFLGAVAFFLRRDRYSVFFGLAAVVSLILATGRYGPPWVVLVTQDLLGEHGLRSPGRFAFLWSFGMAVLAGLGTDWLDRQFSGWGAEPAPEDVVQRPSLKRRLSLRGFPLSSVWLLALFATLAGIAAGLLLGANEARQWLLAHPDAARAWLEQKYMVFDRTVRLRANTEDVYRNLLGALDPSNRYTLIWLASIVAGYGLLVAWVLAGRRFTGSGVGWMRRTTRLVLQTATMVTVAVPLLGAAAQAHPVEPVTTIIPDSPAALYLRDQLAPLGVPKEQRPLYRIYTSQPVYLYRSDVEPNALLPLGIQEGGGYSSLSTEPNAAYAWAAETSQSSMLDVWNARFYLWPNRPEVQAAYGLTSFHPQRPLVSGTGINHGAVASFRIPSVEAVNVRLLATMRDAWAVPAGTVVAWITATDTSGAQQRVPVRVGTEIAEATTPLPADFRAAADGTVAASTEEANYTRPLPAFQLRENGPDGREYPVHFYYAELPLPDPRTIVRLTVQPVALAGAPHAILRVYGLGLGMADWTVHNVLWLDRERYTLVKQDQETFVYRNEQALPRAYLVPLAVTAWKETHFKQMAELGFDPERMVLIHAAPDTLFDAPAAGGWFEPASTRDSGQIVRQEDTLGRISTSPSGRTTVETYAADGVRLTVEARQNAWLFLSDTYDPNWRAYVDGKPQPVFLANAIFRTVAVPAGTHTVEFRYEPAPLQWGAFITLATGVLLLAATAASLYSTRRVKRWSYAPGS